MPQQHYPEVGHFDKFPFFSLQRKNGGVNRIFITNGRGDGCKIYVDDAFIAKIYEAIRQYGVPTNDYKEVSTMHDDLSKYDDKGHLNEMPEQKPMP